jgi:hypothetical protein
MGREGKDNSCFVHARDRGVEHTSKVFFSHWKVVPFRFRCLSIELVSSALSHVHYGVNKPHLPCFPGYGGDEQVSRMKAACVEAA